MRLASKFRTSVTKPAWSGWIRRKPRLRERGVWRRNKEWRHADPSSSASLGDAMQVPQLFVINKTERITCVCVYGVLCVWAKEISIHGKLK
ncbi:hypothetical protein N657DRAFT_648218 [Parathielavia appendiculata]|uniref:Uncharacterized protein n=1 Tax=Parathielavia appendiculata TaxID=2587402 RepID=A0AAN6TVQ9_9PEZI|nr:hypothetical protein N657DRAFT_648218 [Parathielavia appendiculata]